MTINTEHLRAFILASGPVAAVNNVIDLASMRAARPRQAARDPVPTPARELPPALTITAKNSRLRIARRDAWRRAEAVTRFWNAWLDFTDAVSIAEKYGVKEARRFDDDGEGRWTILESYRAAFGRQLLTPAPTMAEVSWKRQQLRRAYIGVDMADVMKAIAEDVAFLESHPTRKERASSETAAPPPVSA